MIDSKSFTEEQRSRIQAWADEGIGLPGIQRRLDEEMGIKATYMETRFLVDDLSVQMPEEEKPEPAEDPIIGDEPATAPDSAGDDWATEPVENPAGEDGAGSVSVTISEVQRPGTVVSGTVTFAGGETADWWMDQFGRLGMDPRNKDFRPSEADMTDFQKELQKAAKNKGF